VHLLLNHREETHSRLQAEQVLCSGMDDGFRVSRQGNLVDDGVVQKHDNEWVDELWRLA
jgi:hypothetical protein